MKRTLQDFCKDNNTSFDKVIDLFYESCMKSNQYDMWKNAEIFVAYYKIETNETKKVYEALMDRFEYKCIV